MGQNFAKSGMKNGMVSPANSHALGSPTMSHMVLVLSGRG